MASHQVIGKREHAINTIKSRYPNIWRLPPQGFDSWVNDFIYEVCNEFGVSRKTAIDYVRVAMVKQKIEAQNIQNLLTYEEDKILNSTPVIGLDETAN